MLPPLIQHRRARTLSGAVAAGLAATLLVAAPAAAAFDPADGREVLGAGVHVDAIYPEVTDGHLEVSALTPDGIVDPDEIALHIPETDSSHVELPDGYEFLGPQGTEAWVTTEVQDPTVVWPGWSFEGIDAGVLKGTLKITYDGFSYAGDAEAPRFAVTQPGGFDGTKVSQLIVPGTTFTSVTGEAGAHTHATWAFTAEGTYDIDFTVDATLADETPISDDVTVRFIVGDLGESEVAPEPVADPEATDTIESLTIVPSKVDAEYFVGQTVTLTALSPDAAEDDTYRWHAIARDGTESVDAEQTTNVFSTKPIRSIDGVSVYAERLNSDGEVVETSDAQTIGVRSHEPTTELTVTADKDSYEVGDTATFVSEQNPPTADEHYHWYLKLADDEEYEWIPESRLADQDLEITADMDGATITGRLFNADHAILAESEPLVLDVTGDDVTSVDLGPISTNKDAFALGDTATFTVEDVADAAAVEWTVRRGGENVFEALDATGAVLEQEIAEDWAGAELRARVTDGGTTIEYTLPAVIVSDSGAADADASAATGHASEAQAAEGEENANAVPFIVGGAALAVLVAIGVIVIVRRRKQAGGER